MDYGIGEVRPNVRLLVGVKDLPFTKYVLSILRHRIHDRAEVLQSLWRQPEHRDRYAARAGCTQFNQTHTDCWRDAGDLNAGRLWRAGWRRDGPGANRSRKRSFDSNDLSWHDYDHDRRHFSGPPAVQNNKCIALFESTNSAKAIEGACESSRGSITTALGGASSGNAKRDRKHDPLFRIVPRAL
jgi:hypothetical protein